MSADSKRTEKTLQVGFDGWVTQLFYDMTHKNLDLCRQVQKAPEERNKSKNS